MNLASFTLNYELGSSVSVVTGYGLGSWGFIPSGGFFIYLLCPASYGAHPASCAVGTGGTFPVGNMQPGCAADHSPPSCAEVKRGAIHSLHPKHLSWHIAGLGFCVCARACVCVCVCGRAHACVYVYLFIFNYLFEEVFVKHLPHQLC
jgi:hypothetical protein